ncbi:3TM-type holin [Tardiphaga sp.]|jgi:hypothetical protein|uniref:3TM-type holin n=1 Tax=Tardiphaga sp. TaxID=1926292 RepID=UPI0037DA18ED
MEWGDLARQVISLGAPMLGTALGGPLGGIAGEILAKTIGAASSTPASVQAALPAVDPNKLAEAEAQWAEMIRAEAETQRAAITETQATIRAELASEDALQRWWRPAYALELTVECGALWAVLMHEFWTGDIQTINALVNATALLATYWGFRFGVLGVYISGRTREKVSAVTGQDAPGMIEKLVKTVLAKEGVKKK